MLQRKVLMSDGIARSLHAITRITHVVGGSSTITVRSMVDAGDEEPCEWQAVTDYDSTMDEGRAYDLVASLPAMAEYTDPIDVVLPLLTDEQAEQVTDLFPAWMPDVSYEVGDRRRYAGRLYRCVQAHTSAVGWEPDVAPALWVRTAEDGEIPEWVQPTGGHDAYARGDKVRHVGKVWASMLDANVWEPGIDERYWAEATGE